MNFIEFIGFIITMILMTYLSSKNRAAKRKSSFEEGSDEEVEALEELMNAISLSPQEREEVKMEIARRQAPPPPPLKKSMPKVKAKKPSRTLGNNYDFDYSLEEYKSSSNIEKRKFDSTVEHRYDAKRKPVASDDLWIAEESDPYAIKSRREIRRLDTILSKLGSKKEMIIIHDILDKPKALKNDPLSR